MGRKWMEQPTTGVGNTPGGIPPTIQVNILLDSGNEESEGNDEAMLAQTGLVSSYLAMSNFLSKE